MSKKKAIISAGLIALLCAAVIVGSTFALFAVTRSSDVAVTTGSVDISRRQLCHGRHSRIKRQQTHLDEHRPR